MVVQESQAHSYSEMLQQQRQHQENQKFISIEELRPRADYSAVATSSSGGHNVYHQQQQSHYQTYYNLTPVQESPCSTVYFGELEPSSAGNAGLSAGGAGARSDGTTTTSLSITSIVNTNSSSNYNNNNNNNNNNSSSGSNIGSAEASGVPAPSAGLVVASEARSSTESSSSSNPSAAESRSQCQRMESSGLPLAASTVMVPEQQQRSAGGSRRHYHNHHHHHHHHSRNSAVSEKTPLPGGSDRSCSVEEMQQRLKKRKLFCHDGSEITDDQGDDAKSVRSNDDSKKQNHSEIEKRRRDKMNTYITELSSMVPMCHAMSRKLDKLTVLRMAVQHLKTILGAVTSYTEGHCKPAFLSDQELKSLILQAAEGFVFVVGCDRGRLLYVSKSVSQTLNYSQGDLLGQSWFDILHPKDVAKVKEQLSSSDLSPRERLIDAKTMLPVKTDMPQGVSRLCPGARRSFFCRMKRKVDARCAESQIKERADTTTGYHMQKKQQNHDWKYCVIQCTGYLKSWAPAKIGLEEQESEADGEACNLSCLVAVGRMQPPLVAPTSTPRRLRLRNIEFVSRHAIDGKFLFVDQRATMVLGFLPQELQGTSMYEYYHHDDIPHLAKSHKAALQSPERVNTQVYRFRSKGASFVRLNSEWRSFRNPWTKEIEYLIAKNSAVFSDTRQVESSANRSEGGSVQENYDYFAQSNGGLERLISSHVEVSKIGRQIAEEVLDLQRRSDQDSSSGSSPTLRPEPALLNAESQITPTVSPDRATDVRQATGSDNISSNPTPSYNHRNNIQLDIIASDQGPPGDEDMMEIIGGTTINESPNPVPTDGNDEAAMAVIMSLLEADAGLGGPVDFSGLPWPLP
ncbi:aryl hydrocarbon receptor nuclear translocator-like protein 1 isoform X2 [Nasonia vitripennis]|uniref:Cycle n=1 Tax=Nasonia vitripennis TaxID=7425 RepID=A0A7M7HH96_NASVI|nr:aryl hydrocarbon receptor nuclear translocator-like protein 1 isoform X2 [Nasonia vitripennis]